MLVDLPPSTRTDLSVNLLSGSTIEDRGDHLMVRTPSNPTYHWGNFVQVTTGDGDDARRWMEVFEVEFPDATYRAIGLPGRPQGRSWADSGLDVDSEESLTARAAPEVTPIPDGYTVHPLVSPDDWAARMAAELAENERTEEYPAGEYRTFMQQQITARSELVNRQRAAWFGAFTVDGALAASLGIVELGDCARYQSVLTAEGHRRQGLARHLLSVAARWALERQVGELVIVADADSAAGRLYARAGFTPGEMGYGAYAAAYPVH